MVTPVTLRSARREDAATIARLSTQLGYPATDIEVAGRLDALVAAPQDNAVIVAASNASVIGWIHILRAQRIELPAFAEIAALVVDDAHRNAGLGERLVDAAMAWAGTKGLTTVRVRSNVIRTDAHRFYQRLGFDVDKTQAVLVRHLT